MKYGKVVEICGRGASWGADKGSGYWWWSCSHARESGWSAGQGRHEGTCLRKFQSWYGDCGLPA
jgi:hypothetical protein